MLITAILEATFSPVLGLQASPPLAGDTGSVLHSSESMCLAAQGVHVKQVFIADFVCALILPSLRCERQQISVIS